MACLVESCLPSPKRKREEDAIEEEEELKLKLREEPEEKEKEKEKVKVKQTYRFNEDWYKNLPEGVSKDPDVWERYYKSIENSYGYEITDYPGTCFEAEIIPDFSSFQRPRCIECARGAIEYYNNKNGTCYEFKEFKAINARCVAGYIYYMTFIAVDEKLGEETFQGKVWSKIRGYEVKNCRIKPQVQV